MRQLRGCRHVWQERNRKTILDYYQRGRMSKTKAKKCLRETGMHHQEVAIVLGAINDQDQQVGQQPHAS